jgi:hypothetical protein
VTFWYGSESADPFLRLTDPDPGIFFNDFILMDPDPDPGGLKIYGSYGSGSATLVSKVFTVYTCLRHVIQN